MSRKICIINRERWSEGYSVVRVKINEAKELIKKGWHYTTKGKYKSYMKFLSRNI